MTCDVHAASVAFLKGSAALSTPAQVARYAVDHARDVLEVEWAELVQPDRRDGVTVLATADPDLTRTLVGLRTVTDDPPPPSEVLAGHSLVVDDLAARSPWPQFGPLAAAQTPVRSAVLSFVDVPGRGAAVLTAATSRTWWFTPHRHSHARLLGDC
jgi:hypothetical protein